MKTSGPPKVSFLIAGTQKGGTTALYRYLRNHPQVCMAKRKEVHFFDEDRFFADGAPDYSFYHSFFNPSISSLVLGEATPAYMYWQPAPSRIWEYNPAMKFVISLRDPILRAFSNWNMERSRGAEPLSFWDALHIEADRYSGGSAFHRRIHGYIARGLYFEQLQRLWAYFPKEQTYVLRQDQLTSAPLRVLNEACVFLGISAFEVIREHRVFSQAYASSITAREWRYLATLFTADIRALEMALNWDCSDWLREPPFLA